MAALLAVLVVVAIVMVTLVTSPWLELDFGVV